MGEEPTMSYNGDVPDPTPPLAPALDTGDSRHTKRVLLVWDAPNLDMGLGAILGGRPTAAYRPRFDALGRWLNPHSNPKPQCSRTSLRAALM